METNKQTDEEFKELHKLQVDEKQAWDKMFNTFCSVFNIPHEELNKEKYRPAFIEVERWGHYNRLLLNHPSIKEKGRGVFWKGD